MTSPRIKPSAMRRAFAQVSSLPSVSFRNSTLRRAEAPRPGRGACGRIPFPSLEGQLQGKLYEPRFSGPLDASKIRSVRKISVWLEELGMIKCVQKIATELQLESLVQRRHFDER